MPIVDSAYRLQIVDNTGMDRDKAEKDRAEGNTCLALGGGLLALSAGTALVAGAVCPLCVIATPALLGYGAYKRIKGGRAANEESATETSTASDKPSV